MEASGCTAGLAFGLAFGNPDWVCEAPVPGAGPIRREEEPARSGRPRCSPCAKPAVLKKDPANQQPPQPDNQPHEFVYVLVVVPLTGTGKAALTPARHNAANEPLDPIERAESGARRAYANWAAPSSCQWAPRGPAGGGGGAPAVWLPADRNLLYPTDR
jgi:hypothetical protein